MMNITPIFLLHGLGSHPITMYPLERHLNHQGYTNTYSVSYNPNREDIEEAVTEVDQIMMKMADKECDEIILIGQSMGGVVANRLHRRGWKVKKAIYIGSPLHGARMVEIARVDWNAPCRNIVRPFCSQPDLSGNDGGIRRLPQHCLDRNPTASRPGTAQGHP